MQTQAQLAVPQARSEVGDLMADLLSRDFKPASIPVASPTAIEPGKRFVKVAEIKGTVEVEREIDFGYSVCAICGLKLCTCTPRRQVSFKQRISYPVEMTVATVIALA